MRKATLLFAVALFYGLLETSHATSCTATTDKTCWKTSFMTGTCSSSVCQCSSGYVPGPYGCQVKQKAMVSADFSQVETGGEILLTCGPAGSDTGYKWYKDGAVISRETGQTYTKANAATTDGGMYTCTSTVAGLVTDVSDGLAVSVVATGAATTKPEVTGMPTKVAVGMVITFTCVGRPKDAANAYKWYIDAHALVGETSATHAHTVVTGDDGKSIKCERSGVQSVAVKFPNSLATNVLGAEVKAVSSLKLIVGETLTLECQLTRGFPLGERSPAITYTWEKDGSTIKGETGFIYTKDTAGISDSGAYKCSVKFDTNAAIKSAAVTVAVKKTLKKDKIVPSNSEPLTGGYFILSCFTKPETTPVQYTWSKDGTPLLGVTDKVLQFNEATADYDGNYTCTATGADWTVTNDPVAVIVAGVTTKTPSMSVTYESSVNGTKLTFTCGNGDVGSPGMTFKWLLNGDELKNITTFNTVTVTLNPGRASRNKMVCQYVFNEEESTKASRLVTLGGSNDVTCTNPAQDCAGEGFDRHFCYAGKCKCLSGYTLNGGLCTSSGSGMVMASLMVIVSALLAQKFF